MTPKILPEKRKQKDHESVSIDLSNQKVGGSEIEMIDENADKLFSKTATGQFLAVSNNTQDNPSIPLNENNQLVSQMLDS